MELDELDMLGIEKIKKRIVSYNGLTLQHINVLILTVSGSLNYICMANINYISQTRKRIAWNT